MTGCLWFSRLWFWMCSSLLSHHQGSNTDLNHCCRKPSTAASEPMRHLWMGVSDTVMESSRRLYQGQMLTEWRILLSTLRQSSKHRACVSQFLCFTGFFISSLPLVFRSRPTLSVGRRDRRCLATAPAGSLLVLVSIYTKAYNCDTTNKWPLWKK